MVEDSRIERLINEIATLKVQVAMVQSLRQAEAVAENVIHEAVATRRRTIQRALRSLVEDGKVKRTGTGIKGDPYRYQNAGTTYPIFEVVPKKKTEIGAS